MFSRDYDVSKVMKEKTYRQEAGFSVTALCWRSLSTPGSSGQSWTERRVHTFKQGGTVCGGQLGLGDRFSSSRWESSAGEQSACGKHPGEKAGWTFSAHTVKISTQTRGRLYHASGPHPSREALPFLHGSASVSNTHSLWTFSSPCMAHYFVLTIGGCYCLHFVHKENLLPRHRITRRASGIPTQQPACLPPVFPFPHSNVLFPVVLSLDFIRVHRGW